ncbi:hypothetical protein Aca07nite_69730 [Actinoplanes capillaceus]|uniref:Uncharacterized protein n=1 Tax=Actinoplanes campanulatus TaxID=113559 RepID=A0ABQ3WU47_9ACTN|nr:hypothetical protein [Actinoplanes capillaceus]GID49698.1 hypothetical protein Aca07nite_69730 [Actinoplanes capillaceus]
MSEVTAAWIRIERWLSRHAPVGPWRAYLIGGGDLWWGLAGETEVNGEPLRPAPRT